MRLIFLGLITATAISPSFADATKYLCVGDQSVGFGVPSNSNRFTVMRFNPMYDKFMVDIEKKEVRTIGKNEIEYAASDCFSVTIKPNGTGITCQTPLMTFLFHKEALKFSQSNLRGAIDQVPDGSPRIVLGSCSPL